ncbi:E3 ubiquitin-protein ligase ZNRF3 [Oryzias melastigma]|uniref:E3 ubiquitin-protein ligase ZNRF3 n=1 Tax=Oryzias melastigma TaxID=30732 RepID=A0A834BVH5_ORYME|nr:E3 ubiquitin-protein ligase ZNRF3 [Oryzias melastigma]
MMLLPRQGGGSARAPDALLLVVLLAAAAASLGAAKDTAFVEVVLFESSPNGDYTTYTTGLQGRFSKAGATISAEGEIVQMHPLGLCNNNDEEDLVRVRMGWSGEAGATRTGSQLSHSFRKELCRFIGYFMVSSIVDREVFLLLHSLQILSIVGTNSSKNGTNGSICRHYMHKLLDIQVYIFD